MQSALALFLVRALKPQQPLLTVEAAGISVKRAVGGNHAMARHNDRNGIPRDRSPHGTGRHNRCFVSRYTMSSRNTLGDLAIRSDLATRDRKQLKPNLALKRRTNHMQRRRKPRLLPRKISIQPRPRTLKHRRGSAIRWIHRRHSPSSGNRIGTFDMLHILFEQRRAKVLLSLKPKPRQTAAISGKQDFAQRRSKRRRDHQRLLSKLRTIIPRIVQTTPIDPKVTLGSRRDSAAAAARSQSHLRQQARTRRSCRPRSTVPQGGRREAPRPLPGSGPATATCSPSAQRPQPTTAPSQAARSSVTAGGGRAWFSEHSADQCGALSAAPKEQDKAPHMVEDVLKTKPGHRRTGHTTRRAA